MEKTNIRCSPTLNPPSDRRWIEQPHAFLQCSAQHFLRGGHYCTKLQFRIGNWILHASTTNYKDSLLFFLWAQRSKAFFLCAQRSKAFFLRAQRSKVFFLRAQRSKAFFLRAQRSKAFFLWAQRSKVCTWHRISREKRYGIFCGKPRLNAVQREIIWRCQLQLIAINCEKSFKIGKCCFS